MGEVSGMHARCLRLLLIVLEELVQLHHHGRDLGREIGGDPPRRTRAYSGDLRGHPAQRPQAVGSLDRRHADETEAEQAERPEQRRPDRIDLCIERASALRHLEGEDDRARRQHGTPFDDPQRLPVEAVAVIGNNVFRADVRTRYQRSVPQRARAERLLTRRADLPVEARIGLLEALIAERPVQPDLPLRADLRRSDQGI